MFVAESLGLEPTGGGGPEKVSLSTVLDVLLGGGLGGAPPGVEVGDELLLANREPGEDNIAAAAATRPDTDTGELSSVCIEPFSNRSLRDLAVALTWGLGSLFAFHPPVAKLLAVSWAPALTAGDANAC